MVSDGDDKGPAKHNSLDLGVPNYDAASCCIELYTGSMSKK